MAGTNHSKINEQQPNDYYRELLSKNPPPSHTAQYTEITYIIFFNMPYKYLVSDSHFLFVMTVDKSGTLSPHQQLKTLKTTHSR